MDPNRFDAFARSLAGNQSRRSVLRRFAAAAAAAAAMAVRPTEAKPKPGRCRGDGKDCSSDNHCCSGFCRHARRGGHGVCAPCESGIVCGEICCPADALNGCTRISGPNGPIIGCLCPCETRYNREENTCRPIRSCESNGDCCSDTCCDGKCCAEGLICCSGECKKKEECVCPPGTGCSGRASCSRCDDTYSTDGVCCEYPSVAFCCTDSSANTGDGSSGCCTLGVDCPQCPAGSGSGLAGHANVEACLERGGTFDECCAKSKPGGDAILGVACCVVDGLPCPEGDPPCCGKCVGRVCACLAAEETCDPDASGCCAGLYCDPRRNTCRPF